MTQKRRPDTTLQLVTPLMATTASAMLKHIMFAYKRFPQFSGRNNHVICPVKPPENMICLHPEAEGVDRYGC